MKAGTLAGPKAWLGALALLGAAMPAMAQPPLRLDTQMFVERVTTDLNGRPRRILASANRLTPGDQLIVLLHWRNEGSAPLRAAAVTRALPRGVELDLSDPAMQLSVDGGVHWGRLDQLCYPRRSAARAAPSRRTSPMSAGPSPTPRRAMRDG